MSDASHSLGSGAIASKTQNDRWYLLTTIADKDYKNLDVKLMILIGAKAKKNND